MTNLFANHALNIAAGQAVSGIADREQTLRVECGKVWITIEGSSRDYWLTAGQSVTLAPGRLVVVEADRTASRVTLPQPVTGRRVPELGAILRSLNLQFLRDNKARTS